MLNYNFVVSNKDDLFYLIDDKYKSGKKFQIINDFVQVYHDYTSVLETMKQSQQEIKKVKVIKRELLNLFS